MTMMMNRRNHCAELQRREIFNNNIVSLTDRKLYIKPSSSTTTTNDVGGVHRVSSKREGQRDHTISMCW